MQKKKSESKIKQRITEKKSIYFTSNLYKMLSFIQKIKKLWFVSMLHDKIFYIKQFYYVLICWMMCNKHIYEWVLKKGKTLRITIM